MNKEKMGKFLKTLRENKGLTMQGLITELNSDYLGVTVKTIYDWEAGNSVPELEKLLFLSNFYKVTIDEILDGEYRINEKSLFDEYYIFSDEFDYISKDYFDNRTKCVEKINKRYKELLLKSYAEELSNNEEIELSFLFRHKCKLNDYFENNYERKSADDYIELKKVINDLKNKPLRNENEFYWEIQKYYDVMQRPITSIDFYSICDEEIFSNSFVSLLLNQSEQWELDMLLAGFQNFEPIIINVDSHSNHLKRYELENNKKFDREKIFKNTIKKLISYGALLNPFFYNFIVEETIEKKIIDRLEELYKLCIRPIEIYVMDKEKEGFQSRFFVENTPFNRFLKEYYSFLYLIDITFISPKELYSLVENDKDNKKLIELLCKSKNIDTNRDDEFIRADLNFELNSWNDKKEKYLNKEKEILNGLKELKSLEEKLNNGEDKYLEISTSETGPKSIDQLKNYICHWKSGISLKEFKSGRNKKLTEQLMSEIDELSISQIREKYFCKEVYRRGEEND